MNTSNAVKQKHVSREQLMPGVMSENQPGLSITEMVSNAAERLAPVWPLETFVACNPLRGFESMPFEEALVEARRLFGSAHAVPKLEMVNRELIKWCGVFLDMGQGTIEAPDRHLGFYRAFVNLSVYDHALHQGCQNTRNWLADLPERAEDCIRLCLSKSGIAPEHQASFIRENLFCLPGWSGYVKWRSEWKNPDVMDGSCPVTLLDFVAVRLVLTSVLWPEARWEKKNLKKDTASVHALVAQIEQDEQAYQHELMRKLMPQLKGMKKTRGRAQAQLVFCIDVRSEAYRRSVESLGPYETLGFAGFFGVPARVHHYNTGTGTDACPVLLKPRHDIAERPISSALACVRKHEQGRGRSRLLRKLYQDLKYNFSSPFALVETLGLWCGLSMLAKTMAPNLTSRASAWFSHLLMPTVPTQPAIHRDDTGSRYGISPAEQADYAESVLRIMGLTENFAQLVVFCGHRSSTRNNPYASSLDCGACGGNHGGASARIIAAILNAGSVRKTLVQRGIVIPDDTLFCAAEHDTTTDAMVIFESGTTDQTHQRLLDQLRQDLHQARQITAQARSLNPQSNAMQTALKQSNDWAEVRPEWGLARNAAIIIGPRQLTRHVNLNGRCFLHSYEWKQDEDGRSLEAILTAPVIVAEWINTQYLFSTLDNTGFGSGSKITHNVTGKVGVMQGNGSDLMSGLPLQSVNISDEEPYHRPQRLLTLVFGKRRIVGDILARQKGLNELILNGWIKLVVIEPEEAIAYQLSREGQWHPLHD
ncbi:DUF2309 domain-containing protein [Legionella sp. CNM-4043-24]|uniref:DUF2309 domain-containing protein n=1 Tax=Legionella sp. CNM-4043-24 TaxID=3421646 RepID=UPI00403B2D23